MTHARLTLLALLIAGCSSHTLVSPDIMEIAGSGSAPSDVTKQVDLAGFAGAPAEEQDASAAEQDSASPQVDSSMAGAPAEQDAAVAEEPEDRWRCVKEAVLDPETGQRAGRQVQPVCSCPLIWVFQCGVDGHADNRGGYYAAGTEEPFDGTTHFQCQTSVECTEAIAHVKAWCCG